MHNDQVYVWPWGRASRVDLDSVAIEVGEVGCGYLGAANVVDAGEEDGGFAVFWKLGVVLCTLFPTYIRPGV